MAIQFNEITRGRAMVFIRIIISEEFLQDRPVAIALTEEGKSIPTKLIRYNHDNEWVLVLPQLDVSIIATIASGHDKDSLLVSPRCVKNSSRFNTLIHNPDAERVRNADAKIRRSAGRIYIDEVIPDWDHEQIVVHGTIETPLSTGSPCHCDTLPMTVLMRDGRPLNGLSWTPLGESIDTDDTMEGVALHRLSFSLRMPSEPPSAIIWAKGLKTIDGDVFLAITDNELIARRNDFASLTCSAMNDRAYSEWFRTHSATHEALALQRVQRFPIEPTFSIVVPLFHTPLDFFDDMTSSALNQTYSKLQLVLVNASPQDVPLTRAVSSLAQQDSRVTVVTLERNLGITENTNRGIAASSGEFVCFLDHDDIIEPNLLYEYVLGINRHTDTDLLYCDEDELDHGVLCKPNFKPDWDPEMLCSHNYVCHMLTVRRSTIDAIPPGTSEFDGAQDHNLTLHAGELARNVYHVRKPLYHWRVSSGSTASDPDAKPYTTTAGILAVQKHIDRMGINGLVSQRQNLPNFYQINYRFTRRPLVSMVIPNKDGVATLNRCLTSISDKTSYQNYEIIIVENGSRESDTFRYYEMIQRDSSTIRVTNYEPNDTSNDSRIINYGAAQAWGEYLVLLDKSTEVISTDWLEQLLGPCMTKQVGIVGAKLLYPDGTIQHSGICFHRAEPSFLGLHLPNRNHDYYEYYQVMRDARAVTKACLLTKHELWNELHGMDESFAANYSDVDYCLRAWHCGYRVIYQPAAELYCRRPLMRSTTAKDYSQALRQKKKEEGLLMSRYPLFYAEGDTLQNPNVEGLYHHLHW